MSFVRRLTSVIALATLVLASFAQTPQPSNPPPQQQHQKCTDNGTYVNSKGETVKRPENCSGSPRCNRKMMEATASATVEAELAHIMAV